MSAPAMVTPSMQIVAEPSSFSLLNLVSAVGRLALTLIAAVILLAAVLVGIAVAGDLPGLFNSQLVDPQIPRDMHREFGNADWPHLFRALGAGASFILAVISTLLFVLARRSQGALPMLRAVAGVGALFLAVVALSHALPDWSQLMPRDNGWEAVDQYMNYTKHNIMGAAIPAGIGILLLAWPTSRARRTRFAVKEEVVS